MNTDTTALDRATAALGKARTRHARAARAAALALAGTNPTAADRAEVELRRALAAVDRAEDAIARAEGRPSVAALFFAAMDRARDARSTGPRSVDVRAALAEVGE